ncbi:MAG: pilus assembly protein N-terminal domain-containing protein [Xanthobacteraceae bacterium]|nr:pilus assembly protein N-terminal domain-containing protein [Xanthobacteraceae bacterium]
MLVSPLPSRRLLAVAVAALALVAARPAAATEALAVEVDQASIVKMPEQVATIVIGNPLIADVVLQGGGTMVVTGKAYGTTNVILLDRAGATLMERLIEVRSPRDNVVFVYRGAERETYSCAPKCERRITLGDSAAYFTATLTQAGNYNPQASNAGKPAR